ncbi:hypothetical protein RUND412_007812 [Rhizina undulata]
MSMLRNQTTTPKKKERRLQNRRAVRHTELTALDENTSPALGNRAQTSPTHKHKCEICFKQFQYLSKLNDHMVVHSYEKNFKCRFCDKRYRRRRELNTHMKRHRLENLSASMCNPFQNQELQEGGVEVPLEAVLGRVPSQVDDLNRVESWARQAMGELNEKHEEVEVAMPLVAAAMYEDVQSRLEHPNAIIYDRQFDTDMFNAVLLGYENVVRLLLSNGYDPNTPDTYFGSVLHVAAAFNTIEIVELLLQSGAEVNAEGGGFGSVLQAATVRGGHESSAIVNLLLDWGADVKFRRGWDGQTVLETAIHAGNREVMYILMERGALLNYVGRNSVWFGTRTG